MIWLIGAGPMAEEYAKVLTGLKKEFKVFGRSAEGAETFTRNTGIPAESGGTQRLRQVAEVEGAPDYTIVAVGPAELYDVTTCLLDIGSHSLLVEKPGSLERAHLEGINQSAAAASVQVAYNRRFYSSTQRAREILQEDGGVTSFQFEVTEWSHVISKLKKDPAVLRRWFLANTTHVVDLAWHLGGFPAELACFQAGTLDWHPAASRFAGAGSTERGATFSYFGDWLAPGRWSLEFSTPKHRLIFRPMESLQIQNIGSVQIEPVIVDDSLDTLYKPGLYLQISAFLNADYSRLCSLEEHLRAWDVYARMAGYDS